MPRLPKLSDTAKRSTWAKIWLELNNHAERDKWYDAFLAWCKDHGIDPTDILSVGGGLEMDMEIYQTLVPNIYAAYKKEKKAHETKADAMKRMFEGGRPKKDGVAPALQGPSREAMYYIGLVLCKLEEAVNRPSGHEFLGFELDSDDVWRTFSASVSGT